MAWELRMVCQIKWESKVNKVKQLFDEMNKNEIDYVVMWGYENLPESKEGTDIDLLVNPYHMTEFFSVASSVYGMNPIPHPEYSGPHKLQKESKHSHYMIGPFDIWTGFCVGIEGNKITGPRGMREILSPGFATIVLTTKETYNQIKVASKLAQAAMTILRVIRDKKEFTDVRKSRITAAKGCDRQELINLLLIALPDLDVENKAGYLLEELDDE